VCLNFGLLDFFSPLASAASLETPYTKLATSMPVFASLAVAKEVKQVYQETAVKRQSTAAQEIML